MNLIKKFALIEYAKQQKKTTITTVKGQNQPTLQHMSMQQLNRNTYGIFHIWQCWKVAYVCVHVLSKNYIGITKCFRISENIHSSL